MTERNETVTFQGNPLTLVGHELKAEDPAPDATLLDNELNEVKLSGHAGGVRVLVAVPSLDTSVCDAEARRFNEEAGKLGGDVKVLVISMDLPFAQARWCGAAGIEHVQTLSDHRDASFGEAYGVLIKELRLLARSIFVVGPDDKVKYVQLVNEMTDEPDYDEVLAAVRALM
jgi:thiol peroxidase